MRPFEQKRHASGLCIQCAKPKPDHYLRCPDCRAKVNRNSARYFKEVTQPVAQAARRRTCSQTNCNHA